MDFIRRTLPILFGIFLLSVAVRLPQLNRPLSKHHEFCTAVSLRIMQIWYDNGIRKYGFNPVMTYNNEADKSINNSANASGKMIDKNGNYYYVSHPPFAYYFPFFIFKALHIRPDVLPMQILNLGFHFMSGLVIYFIVCLLSFNRGRSLPYRSAVVAFVVYIFMPVTLWFQGNVYMSDMAVHLLFVIAVYIALKMIIRQKFYSPKYLFFYIICLALMIYTSWLGLFFAFGIVVYSLLHVRDNKGFSMLLWTTVLITVVMLRLIVYQYAQINGLTAYLAEMTNRYITRGSLEGTEQGLLHFMFSYLLMIKTLFYNYIINYAVIYVALVLFMWLVISRKKLKIVFSDNGYKFIWLSVLPVLLLHFFFLNYSGHDFTTLYGSLFFSVLAGILYDKVKKSGTIPLRKMQTGLVVIVFLMVAQYEVMNWPLNPTRYTYQKQVGEYIKTNAPKDAVIFTAREDVDPQIIFYAQRNIKYVKDRNEALTFLASTGRNKGVGVDFSNQTGAVICNINRNFPADSLALHP